MKAYKLEVLVIDHEGHSPDEIKRAIENTKYIDPSVLSIRVADIGEWSDEHPLNKYSTQDAEVLRLFPPHG